jgi:iron(II)-dependent oxidoreductase
MKPNPFASFSKRVAPIAVGFAVLVMAGTVVPLMSNRAHPIPDALQAAEQRRATPPGMVYRPAGEFWYGSDDPDADEERRPRRRVFLPAFYMDRTEVTNREFQRFRPAHTYPVGEDNLPATNITYDEAAAYATWAGKRLPTEQEWEKAARGTDGRRYPWGDTWDPQRIAARARPVGKPEPLLSQKIANACRIGHSRVRTVGSVPGGVSPYGCLDMAGNAWEWVAGFYNGNPEQRILRGGAVGYGERACRTYERGIEGAKAT